MDEFGGNSFKQKSENKERSPVTPITTNVVKKDSEIKKFGRKLIVEDGKTVFGHVIDEIVIPNLKRGITDFFKGFIDRLFYGSNSVSRSNNGIISYQNYWNKNGYVSNPSVPTPINYNQPKQPSLYAVQTYVFQDRGPAEAVLAEMRERCEAFGMVSVADFYDMIGQAGNTDYTNNKFGWRNLSTATIERDGSGFVIRFPKIEALE